MQTAYGAYCMFNVREKLDFIIHVVYFYYPYRYDSDLKK